MSDRDIVNWWYDEVSLDELQRGLSKTTVLSKLNPVASGIQSQIGELQKTIDDYKDLPSDARERKMIPGMLDEIEQLKKKLELLSSNSASFSEDKPLLREEYGTQGAHSRPGVLRSEHFTLKVVEKTNGFFGFHLEYEPSWDSWYKKFHLQSSGKPTKIVGRDPYPLVDSPTKPGIFSPTMTGFSSLHNEPISSLVEQALFTRKTEWQKHPFPPTDLPMQLFFRHSESSFTKYLFQEKQHLDDFRWAYNYVFGFAKSCLVEAFEGLEFPDLTSPEALFKKASSILVSTGPAGACLVPDAGKDRQDVEAWKDQICIWFNKIVDLTTRRDRRWPLTGGNYREAEHTTEGWAASWDSTADMINVYVWPNKFTDVHPPSSDVCDVTNLIKVDSDKSNYKPIRDLWERKL